MKNQFRVSGFEFWVAPPRDFCQLETRNAKPETKKC